MTKRSLLGRRVLGVVMVLGLVAALAPSAWSVKPDAVRTFNMCMQTCNELKDICDAGCTACGEDAECLDACLTACARVMQHCKGACKYEKSGKEPNIPD